MKVQNYSSLLRVLDPRYWTNLAIGTASALVMLGGFLYRLFLGAAPLAAAWWGIVLGAGVFLGWAIGREIDPDHPLSAFAAAGMSLVGILLWGLPALAASYWLLVVARMVARTTGLPPTIGDSLILLGVSLWFSRNGNWHFPILMALAFYLDGRLRAGNPRQVYLSILALVLGGVILALGGSTPRGEIFASEALAVVLGLGLVSLLALLRKRDIESTGDFSNEKLDAARVAWSGRLVLAAGILFAIHSGRAGLVAILPAWAALLSTFIWWTVERIQKST